MEDKREACRALTAGISGSLFTRMKVDHTVSTYVKVVVFDTDMTISRTSKRIQALFDLTDRVAIVTGGSGLMGGHHGSILAAAGAHVVLLDLEGAHPWRHAASLRETYG